MVFVLVDSTSTSCKFINPCRLPSTGMGIESWVSVGRRRSKECEGEGLRGRRSVRRGVREKGNQKEGEGDGEGERA